MEKVRAHRKLAIVLLACVLAIAGAVVGVIVVGGGRTGAAVTPTTGAYAPISVSRPKLYKLAGTLTSDPEAGIQTDLGTSVSQLPGVYRYRITVTNTSSVGYIDSFQWYPPTGVRIVRVLGSSVGKCELTGLTGFGGDQFKAVLLYPNISCQGVKLKPPSCTCLGDGGSVELSFVADRSMGGTGWARMISARLVLHPIPSSLQARTSTSARGENGP